LGSLADLATLFAIVFTLNIIPAFAPPTWLALSWIGFDHPQANPVGIAVFSAFAATCGRILLAKLSRIVIRQRFMGAATRANIDVIKDKLDGHRTLTFGSFLIFAFSPFPSNYLFIAYGLTTLPIWLVAVPFFMGRCVSYSFFVFAAAELSQRLATHAGEAGPYFGVYFVVTQLLFLGLVLMVPKVDWKHVFARRTFRWLRQAPTDPDSN
jgi:hypothetical protein